MNYRTMISALALSAALFAGAATTAAPAFAQGATISGGFDVGPGGFQGNFHPWPATGGFTWLVTYCAPLVIYDDKLANVIGALAERYEVSADQKAYTFKLVDTKWHDGKPFTSKDVKFTIELAKNDKAGSVFAARLGAIDAVETPDDRTVIVKLSTATPSMLDTLTKLMMLPEHALASIPAEQIAKNAWWSTSPLGTGPFKFTKYVADQYVELAANPDYHGGKPAAEKLINRYFANPAAAIAALPAGEIQITNVDYNHL
jgi:peptide/nickel transport system substrate-binding protein